MNHTERSQRRVTFDKTSADYDAVRPGYPAVMYEDLISYSRLKPDAHILEIGCGSGQATLPLARVAYNITAIDISSRLTALARTKLSPFNRVKILNCSFEEFEDQYDSYDLVMAATAMHWIDPAVRYHKTASLLKDGGVIAVIRNTHPRSFRPGAHLDPGSSFLNRERKSLPLTDFFNDTSPIYHRLVPEWQERKDCHSDPGSEIKAELKATDLFEQISAHSYSWTATFTRDEYLRLMHTFSDHLRLGEERLQQVCDAIGELIDRRYDGMVKRPYITEMLLGRKRRS